MVQFANEIIVDSFSGGGGASEGIRIATRRHPDIAINHDREAIALHTANHPTTEHFAEDVWAVDPITACAGRPVGLMWLSPDCKHFSKAKGGKPVSKKVRGLAWVAHRWAKAVKPRVIVLENVEEFRTWGPLGKDGRPAKKGEGRTFKLFVRRMTNLGYDVQWRELRGCDFGAPTMRKRLIMIMRCDGQPIVWPERTHGPHTVRPWRTAAECIDWSIPVHSIFLTKKQGKAVGVKRPLAEATMRRIRQGIDRYILNTPTPFIVNLTHGGRLEALEQPFKTITGANRGEKALVVPSLLNMSHGRRLENIDQPLNTTTTTNGGERALVAATLINTRNGEREGQSPRVRDVTLPYLTVTASGSQGALVAAFMAQHNTDVVGHAMTEPVSTIVGKGCTQALVNAFLLKYYGTDQDPRIEEPLHSITTKDRFGLVTVEREQYQIVDIGMRMLTPRELYTAQGFGEHYQIKIQMTKRLVCKRGKNKGKVRFVTYTLSKAAQIRMCGNSVCPPLAAAIVAANYNTTANTEEVAA